MPTDNGFDQDYYPNDENIDYGVGNLEFMSDLIRKMINNPDIGELQDYLRQGYDPRTRGLINQGQKQYTDLLNAPPAYGEAELDRFRKLVSGEFFTDEMAGSFRERVRRGMQPKRQEVMASLAARGLGSSGGEMGSALGKLAAEENVNFQDIAANKFLEAVGYGTAGLGAADTAMLNRQQTAYGMGSDLRNFLENSQMNRVGIGANLAQMSQQDLMNLLNMSTQFRLNQKPNTFQQVTSSVLPFAISAMSGGFNPVALAPLFSGGTTGGITSTPSGSSPGGAWDPNNMFNPSMET